MAQALPKLKQVARSYVINPFTDMNFDLASAISSENDAEDRFKEKLMVNRKKSKQKKAQLRWEKPESKEIPAFKCTRSMSISLG
ncbi:hypothetical protein H0178_49340 [Cytobacillus firmus]|nr:hypothetical protein [Cytobacillus firmus]